VNVEIMRFLAFVYCNTSQSAFDDLALATQEHTADMMSKCESERQECNSALCECATFPRAASILGEVSAHDTSTLI